MGDQVESFKEIPTCEHDWIPYILLPQYPVKRMGAGDFVYHTKEIVSLKVVRIKCPKCGEERALE